MGGGGSQIPGAQQDYLKLLTQSASGPLSLLSSQIAEALRTGGVGAQIPVVQKATEASGLASGQARQNTQASLARSGLSGTPFGERILAEQGQSAALARSQLGPQIAQQFIGMAPGLTGQATQSATGLVSAGMQGNAAQQAAKQQTMGQLMGGLFQAGGSIGGGFATPDTTTNIF